jgi:hypothetical protein
VANNYLQFSLVLDGSEWTSEARAWLYKKICEVHEADDGSFVCSVNNEEKGLWLYAEEVGDPDMLAKLIQKTIHLG